MVSLADGLRPEKLLFCSVAARPDPRDFSQSSSVCNIFLRWSLCAVRVHSLGLVQHHIGVSSLVYQGLPWTGFWGLILVRAAWWQVLILQASRYPKHTE